MSGVIVTGGASGIGAATCVRLAAEGMRVAVVDRDEAGARSVADAVGGVAVVGDVRSAPSVVSDAAAALDGITGLVNNAGVGNLKPLEAYTDAEWAELVSVNLTACFAMTRAVAPIMREAGGGAIVNVASVAAGTPTRGEAPYCAAKAGMVALTKSSAMELAPLIRVNSVSPGFIESPLTAGVLGLEGVRDGLLAATPLGRLGSPDEVADVICFLLSEGARYVTGQDLFVDGGSSLISAQADPMLRGLLAMLYPA